ncbi:helix-turn-helix domain-containing protein [Candidatus Margulisiibacteriota bacterium]
MLNKIVAAGRLKGSEGSISSIDDFKRRGEAAQALGMSPKQLSRQLLMLYSSLPEAEKEALRSMVPKEDFTTKPVVAVFDETDLKEGIPKSDDNSRVISNMQHFIDYGVQHDTEAAIEKLTEALVFQACETMEVDEVAKVFSLDTDLIRDIKDKVDGDGLSVPHDVDIAILLSYGLNKVIGLLHEGIESKIEDTAPKKVEPGKKKKVRKRREIPVDRIPAGKQFKALIDYCLEKKSLFEGRKLLRAYLRQAALEKANGNYVDAAEILNLSRSTLYQYPDPVETKDDPRLEIPALIQYGIEAGSIPAVELLEKEAIKAALRINNNNHTRTAEALGVKISMLYKNIKQYGLD